MAHKRRKDHQFLDFDTAALVHHEVRELFNKKITLKERQQQWCLPHCECLLKDEPFVISELISLKKELNATKSLLNDKDIEEWNQHTRHMHKAGLVVKHLREKSRAEMCTQAWAKFKEILGTYNLIPSQAIDCKKINTVHLCEAPGAFIACMNHHLKNNLPGVKWHWTGTTLNPYYEGNDLNAMLDDDSFIFETRENWNFGEDGTGDLMNLQNLLFLKQDLDVVGPVHLVTADGSVNCADDPGEQEQIVSQLIFCESVAAMEVLCEGCNYVFKMFTALECHMICMLYLLCCVFEEVHLAKPATSKAGNSEVYVICMHYCRSNLPLGYQEILHGIYSSSIPDKTLFPLKCLPVEFIERLYKSQHFFIDKQRHEIVQHIQFSNIMTKRDKHFIYHVRNETVQHYVDLFNVKPLDKSDRVIQECFLDGIQHVRHSDFNRDHHYSNRTKCGTYNERHNKTWLQLLQQDEHFQPKVFSSLTEIHQASNGVQLIPLSSENVLWLELGNKSNLKFSFVKGKKITNVLNSRFCSSYFINNLNTAMEKTSITTCKDWREMSQLAAADHLKCPHCNFYSIIVVDQLVKFTEEKLSSLLLGIQCHCLGNYLQSQGIHSGTSHSQAVDLVIVPILDISLCEYCIGPILELQTKKIFLESCITALKLLKPGGTFVCQLYSSLTRFTVGILYILHCLFQRVAIIKPVVDSLWCPNRYLVCKGYIGLDQQILSSLIMSHDLLATCQQGEDLLELINMKSLYEDEFFEFVKKMNEQLAHIQLVDIVNRESFTVDIINKQNTALGKEAMSHFNIAVTE